MKLITILLGVITLFVYYSANVPPTSPMYVAVLPFFLPLLLLLLLILVIYWLVKKSFFLVVPLAILLIGTKFIRSTFAINQSSSEDFTTSFNILSYNVSFFKKPNLHYFEGDQFSDEIPAEASAIKNWITTQAADIMCFQEYYNDDNSSTYNTIASLVGDEKYNYYFSSDKLGINKAQYGVVTFSRFPIVEQGDIFISDNRYNRAIFTDLAIYTDTVRVINVHLQSMELRGNNPMYANSVNSAKSNALQIYYKLRSGFIHHSQQTEEIMNYIETSPYPVIVCGDFNESPYGYIYQSFNEKMSNAFEEAGNGFGFSYNGNTLPFLRIDHQFFQDEIEILDFTTYEDVKYSEHHPIQATYQLKP
ncbi:endonuclease/exonuclease/phosphatase family protein [Tunicatimonas pelagia]|uniref:endonuclease/exonuclease/phosphatase family protein n=1 Tax=Tunicatimonas pelagia TaxID=931531 RepID=UPI0026655874|nr:endonuclease/exonuclease/phosphatase family protein [Tunicatimonas pelagia]WKN42328.1 endonuclease/exonuclease/phosphatase family protein [Tunicatimonas pelagia]